jgi:thymidylate synthase (FAD)
VGAGVREGRTVTEIRFRSDMAVKLVQHVGGDSSVVAAAKVSVEGAESVRHLEADATSGLIRYLMRHRHGTPFEHASLTFFASAPIFVWREWHRHRIGFSYNEESARYKTLDPVFYLPPRDRPMMKVDGWKPGRPKFLRCEDDTVYEGLRANLIHAYDVAYSAYLANLSLGIDPGLARDCLPVGIYSSCYVTCNPRSLMAFLSLRTHDETAKAVSYPLYEIEECARQCEALFAGLFPATHAAFVDNGRQAP